MLWKKHIKTAKTLILGIKSYVSSQNTKNKKWKCIEAFSLILIGFIFSIFNYLMIMSVLFWFEHSPLLFKITEKIKICIFILFLSKNKKNKQFSHFIPKIILLPLIKRFYKFLNGVKFWISTKPKDSPIAPSNIPPLLHSLKIGLKCFQLKIDFALIIRNYRNTIIWLMGKRVRSVVYQQNLF